MPIRFVHHINIVTPRLEESRAFFVDVLGLRQGPRPGFSSTGYWLYAGERAVVHIQAATLEVGPSRRSVLNHFAFEVAGLDALLDRLDRYGAPYQLTTVPGTRVRQVFVEDPSGVRFELSEPTETDPDWPWGI
jgi:catechol 2,3-dioxygenase-like lactoylglutathione lyase family enzyme